MSVTRANFERLAETEAPPMAAAIKALLAGSTDPAALAPLSANPTYNAQMRTTCVATLLEAGTVENALPQTARATVNCRILPDEPVEETAEHPRARHRRRKSERSRPKAGRRRRRPRRRIPR